MRCGEWEASATRYAVNVSLCVRARLLVVARAPLVCDTSGTDNSQEYPMENERRKRRGLKKA